MDWHSDFFIIYVKFINYLKSRRYHKKFNSSIWETPTSYTHRLLTPFTQQTDNFFWITVNWPKLTEPLLTWNISHMRTHYYSRLRNFSLVDYRQAFLEIHALPLELSKQSIDIESKIIARFRSVAQLAATYRVCFHEILVQRFFFMKKYQKNNWPLLFSLFFKFRTNKLFVTMQNDKFINLFFISLGFFLKYFEKRKALKKSKTFKLLLSRSLRKILLLANISKLRLFVSGTPIHFIDILRTLNRRIDHAFANPFSKIPLDESNPKTQKTLVKIPYFFFTKNTAFVPVKTRKRGRIKRKLRRRLNIKNRVTD